MSREADGVSRGSYVVLFTLCFFWPDSPGGGVVVGGYLHSRPEVLKCS